MQRRIVVCLAVILSLVFASAIPAYGQAGNAENFPVIQLPSGYQIEKVVGGLTYLTALEWDDQGRMYVLEAGGAFVEEPVPARLMRIEGGRATEVVNLTATGVGDSVVGMTWHDGAFYITHRDGQDRTGAVSRVTLDGTRTQLFSGIIDSQSEHQINDIKVGPDGRMYVAVGPATNAGVVGLDLAPFVMRSPMVQHRPCQDLVLTGRTFRTPDFRTPAQGDIAETGAFVPFGTSTMPGHVVPGTNKCGGSILVFDPNNAEATLRPYAHGFRNIIGLAWDTRTGAMYGAVNGYDIRGSRSVQDQWDATYRIREGAWYGWPDFSATLEPVTSPKFSVPDTLQAPVFINGEMQSKDLGFVIDHAASGLTPPDRSLVAGLHGWNSSPSMLDVAPDSWGELAGHLFVAEWGDLAPPTNPLRAMPIGYQISRLDPRTGRVEPFVRNAKPGPASAQGAMGMGMERPFDVKFGPDGAMYIADYGIALINPARAAEGKPPYEFPPNTGVVWKVTRTGDAPTRAAMPPADTFMAFWRANGGLAVFGNPITEQLEELNPATRQIQTVQYFERQRFEYHPANRGTPYEVQLGRLGAEMLERQGRDWLNFPKADPGAPHYFAETGHAIAPQFWEYWRSHGLELGDRGVSMAEALALFGYPLSEAQIEVGANGEPILTQWFERARFEYHPNNPDPYQVLLGRLGAELLPASGR